VPPDDGAQRRSPGDATPQMRVPTPSATSAFEALDTKDSVIPRNRRDDFLNLRGLKKPSTVGSQRAKRRRRAEPARRTRRQAEQPSQASLWQKPVSRIASQVFISRRLDTIKASLSLPCLHSGKPAFINVTFLQEHSCEGSGSWELDVDRCFSVTMEIFSSRHSSVHKAGRSSSGRSPEVQGRCGGENRTGR
jgi:hypothetical protein